ncbi:hypothetical protein [Saccharopolyspora sp. NPDC002376]
MDVLALQLLGHSTSLPAPLAASSSPVLGPKVSRSSSCAVCATVTRVEVSSTASTPAPGQHPLQRRPQVGTPDEGPARCHLFPEAAAPKSLR